MARDEIRNDIFTNFWNERLQSFVQSKGTEDLDASALLMPHDALHQPCRSDVAFDHEGD